MYAALRGTGGISPRDAVVPGGGAFDVMGATQDRVAAATGQVQLGNQLLELGWGAHERLGTIRRVHQAAGAFGAHRHLGMGEPDDPLGLVEDRGAGLLLERLVHHEGVLVEADRLGDAVVRSDDRRVPARVARGDVVGLEDGDIRDAVAGGEVVRRGQAVAAAADDDDVVTRSALVPADREQGVGVLAHDRHPSRTSSSWA